MDLKNAKSFKIGKVEVKTGGWIVLTEGHYTVYARICDNKFDGCGVMVYAYNPSFPNGHEATYLSVKKFTTIGGKALDAIPQAAKDASDRFLADCDRGHYE